MLFFIAFYYRLKCIHIQSNTTHPRLLGYVFASVSFLRGSTYPRNTGMLLLNLVESLNIL